MTALIPSLISGSTLSRVTSFAAFVYDVWTPHVYPGIRLTTQRAYDSVLKHHILPAFGHMPIASIGYKEITTALAGLQRADKTGPLPARRANEVAMRTKEILGLYATLATAEGRVARTDWKIAKAAKKNRKKVRPEPPVDFTTKILGACTGRFARAKGPVFAPCSWDCAGVRSRASCGPTSIETL